MKWTKMKTILITLLWKQNSYHKHGVLVHTLRVLWEVLKARHWRMIPAAILHDIGKPSSAHQKPEDVINREYSFTDHEEVSYQMIKNWPLISDYTKALVRYHYIIRRIEKAKKKGLAEYEPLLKEFQALPRELRKDISIFMSCDDRGKGLV